MYADGEYVGTEHQIGHAKELARKEADELKKGSKKKLQKKKDDPELAARADTLAKGIKEVTQEFNHLLKEASASTELVVVVAFDEEEFELDCEVFQKVK